MQRQRQAKAEDQLYALSDEEFDIEAPAYIPGKCL